MPRTLRMAAAAALTLSAAWTAAAGLAPRQAGITNSEAPEVVRRVLPVVERIRGLRFRHTVPCKVIDDRQATRYFLARFFKFYDRSILDVEQSAYILLGLLPPGTDLLKIFSSVMEEQAGGYYDPSSGAFYLLDDMPRETAPILISHELTHALEDQYYDLDRRLMEVADDADRVFARSAVHEGSATLVMTLYITRALTTGELPPAALRALAKTEAARGEKLSAMPSSLRRPLMGTYVLGLSFLLRGDAAAQNSGTFPSAAVDRCYRRGPRSSEQILHPEKFWDEARRDDPVVVDLGDAGRALGWRWKRAGTGVLGELDIGVLVGAPTPSTRELAAGPTRPERWTNEAAAGWGGDRWELWRRGDREAVLLLTEWDTEKDAREFAAALPERPNLAWRRSGRRVALVAGDAGSRANRVLTRMLRDAPSANAGHESGARSAVNAGGL